MKKNIGRRQTHTTDRGAAKKRKEKMKIIAKNDNVKKGYKFESPNGDYKYVIKDIDYSLTPNMVQMMYVDSKNTNDRETFTIKLAVLLSYIKNDIIIGYENI